MCKVSILIPIYNVERYLRQCLDSVVNQTLKDIEIICINDGSTDSSPDIIREYAEKDSRIRVIDKENTGYGHSMNCGLKLAQGEYIGIVESDDFAELNMFETLYNTAKEVDAEIVKSNWFKQIGQYFFPSKAYAIYDHQFITPEIFNLSSASAIWNAIYKREFLLKNDIHFNETPGASYQDFSFYYKMMACVKKMFFIKDSFLHYRIDNPNSSLNSKQKAFCMFDEFKEIQDFLMKRPELQNPWLSIICSIKCRHYLGHYLRVDDKFKFDLITRAAEEVERDYNAGYVKEKYCSENEWQNIQLLLKNKKEFFYKQHERKQTFDAYLHGIFPTIQTFRNIYIFGAGMFAASVLNSFYLKNIHVENIVVSNAKDNPDNVMGLPVVSLNDSNIDKERDVIILAIKEESQYELLYQLQKDGYKNIVIIPTVLRRYFTDR